MAPITRRSQLCEPVVRPVRAARGSYAAAVLPSRRTAASSRRAAMRRPAWRRAPARLTARCALPMSLPLWPLTLVRRYRHRVRLELCKRAGCRCQRGGRGARSLPGHRARRRSPLLRVNRRRLPFSRPGRCERFFFQKLGKITEEGGRGGRGTRNPGHPPPGIFLEGRPRRRDGRQRRGVAGELRQAPGRSASTARCTRRLANDVRGRNTDAKPIPKTRRETGAKRRAKPRRSAIDFSYTENNCFSNRASIDIVTGQPAAVRRPPPVAGARPLWRYAYVRPPMLPTLHAGSMLCCAKQ